MEDAAPTRHLSADSCYTSSYYSGPGHTPFPTIDLAASNNGASYICKKFGSLSHMWQSKQE
jgi:hypothetical protein